MRTKRKSLLNIVILLLCCLPVALTAQVNFFDQADQFFRDYVDIDGLVDYRRIQDDPSTLNALKKTIADYRITEKSRAEQKAFWINTYNVLTIATVMQYYPMQSPEDRGDFFTRKRFTAAGERLSLNAIEREKLLAVDKDARLHFVLVCAAVDCPALSAAAYRPEQLSEQMDQKTRAVLNNGRFIRLDEERRKIRVSEIFRWYLSDFGNIRDYINQYRDEALPTNYKLDFYPYNWALNEVGGQGALPFRASVLLKKGEFEAKIFNSLYTQRDFNGFERLNSRSSFFSSFGQFLFGVNSNLNIGADVVYKSNVINDFANSSPFRALRFQQSQNFQTFNCAQESHNVSDHSKCLNSLMPGMAYDTLRNSSGDVLTTTSAIGLAHFGPKVKFNPVRKWKYLSLQQTLFVPIEQQVDGQWISFTQLFYDKPIGSRSQIFIEASLWTPVAPNFRIDPFVRAFYSYFPVPEWTLYGMASLPGEYGLGTKYFLTPEFEVELLYTYYLPFDLIVPGRRAMTFNLGLRYRT